ncbi:UDP-glycosyltransferase 79B9-like [Syzygium oleosum]|uniref:UDP-glycosyltransferase 79B9-like n=1 Tax=Syzygium oleosum TaxID=219896 RepID=UPI0024BB884B|nr:UDP-glycosyltransferase 79B9-like [Syzygium oleosum]
MESPRNSRKLRVVMFPWFAISHGTQFLHLSNKLAQNGHRVTFLLPQKAQLKLEPLNQHQDLVRFSSITVPQVDGLPSGAETASDVPVQLHRSLYTAFDQTRDQIQPLLIDLKPDIVFFDFAPWIPAITRPLNIKAIYYVATGVAGLGLRLTPARRISKGVTIEELMHPPPGYPSLRVVPEEAFQALFLAEDLGSGMSFYDRITTSLRECDAIATRTYHELEGKYGDYLGEQYGKPVLYSGPVIPQPQVEHLEEKWASWLNMFGPSSVVFCAFGSEIKLTKEKLQEILLGFERSGHPFLVALATPQGCDRIEEAFPHGFGERTQERGLVSGDWVPQSLILKHPSVGCFVTHCGYASMWEALFSDCRILTFPQIADQFMTSRLMVDELRVAVEVKKEGERESFLSKESLSEAIKLVMDKDGEVASRLKTNHAKLKDVIAGEGLQERYMRTFLQNLQSLLVTAKPSHT